MKLALHFNEDAKLFKKEHEAFRPIARALVPHLVSLPAPRLNSQMFIGSLLFDTFCRDRVDGANENEWTGVLDKELYIKLVEGWANPPPQVFSTLTERTFKTAMRGNIFVICLSQVDMRQAAAIDKALQEFEWYLGAVEVAETYPPHALAYAHGLVAFGRVFEKDFHLFWDGSCQDSKDDAMAKSLKRFGFRQVKFEALNGRYTIFDKRHSPANTFQAAEALALSEGLLASTAERVVRVLVDVAPSLPEKLHAALKAFQDATTAEEFAQVALSCRRVIEYVADCIFPPQAQPSQDGRKLDRRAYRNRLLAFADAERRSDTSIDLIVASTATLAEQWGRLQEAVNKGLHADMIEPEVRRCLVRTILLLDDLISLKAGPFPMKPELDWSIITGGREDSE